MVTVHPFEITVPTPEYVTPLMQARYSPVRLLNNTTVEGLESSCKQPLKTFNGKLQVAVLPDISVAVHVTVVVPKGNVDPLAGMHATVAPGQLSVTPGSGKVTTVLARGGHPHGATAVKLAGQVITGGSV